MDKVQLDELIATDYKNLISIAKIKNKYKTSYERIKRVSIERNIWNPEGRTFYMKKHCKDHLRSVKENPFQDLKDDNVQYWLGMLITDGNITNNCISLSLSTKDFDHIEKYKKFLKSSLKITINKDRRFDNSSMSKFTFCNFEVVNFLETLGITKRKTFTVKYNGKINWNFLRGVIDGDGCYYKGFNKKSKTNHCRISIATASYEFAKQISNFYKENQIKHTLYSVKNRNIFYLNVDNFINCKKLIYNLYKNANTFMRRKYINAQLISNYQLKTDLKFREPALGILSEINTP